MKWTKVIIPVVFKKFQVVYIFFAIFFFSLSLPIGKKSTLAKIWGAPASQQPLRFLPRFLRALFISARYSLDIHWIVLQKYETFILKKTLLYGFICFYLTLNFRRLIFQNSEFVEERLSIKRVLVINILVYIIGTI